MNNLTTLEKEILTIILSSFLSTKEHVNSVIDTLRVKDRVFSALERNFCSGFYTHFENNIALYDLKDVPHDFCVQAGFDQLAVGEMGFIIFCDAATKSLVVIEGYLYGDDRISVHEFLKDEHTFSLYALPGM